MVAPSVADPMAGVLTPRVAPPAPHGHAGRPRALESVEVARATWARMLERHVDVLPGDDACWLWMGGTNYRGYGRVWLAGAGRMGTAHIVALVAKTGRLVPVGLVVDHICRTPSCVRPEHLRVLNVRENNLAGVSRTAVFARQTRCKRGHLLSNGNISQQNLRQRGWRLCATCGRRARWVRGRLFGEACALTGLSTRRFMRVHGSRAADFEAVLREHAVDLDALREHLWEQAAIRYPDPIEEVAA